MKSLEFLCYGNGIMLSTVILSSLHHDIIGGETMGESTPFCNTFDIKQSYPLIRSNAYNDTRMLAKQTKEVQILKLIKRINEEGESEIGIIQIKRHHQPQVTVPLSKISGKGNSIYLIC